MNDLRTVLRVIEGLTLTQPVRVMHLCGDHERVIALSDMRRMLPRQVDLVAGPGSAASICPEEDLRAALRLVERRAVTLMVSQDLLRLPLSAAHARPRSLYEAKQEGADIRVIEAPIEAIVAARDEPRREWVMFVAGFETLLAPLAGMVCLFFNSSAAGSVKRLVMPAALCGGPRVRSMQGLIYFIWPPRGIPPQRAREPAASCAFRLQAGCGSSSGSVSRPSASCVR